MVILPLTKYSENTHFVRESISVWLTSCFTCLDSVALLILNQQQIYFFGQISTSQSGGQLHSDTSTYKVSQYSMIHCTTPFLSPLSGEPLEPTPMPHKIQFQVTFQAKCQTRSIKTVTRTTFGKVVSRLKTKNGGRHSSVVSSAPTILRPGFESQAHHLCFFSIIEIVMRK